jgi:undecaprenyl-diphosphatase
MDTEILIYLNGFVGRSDFFDNFVKMLENPIIKAMPFVLGLIYLWFREGENQIRQRSLVLATIATSIVAIAIGRGLALLMPFRARPIHDPMVDIRLPHGHTTEILEGWSSMPSDHAIYFTALCTFFFLANRWLGVFFSLYAFVIVLVPRVYFGWHWPSDIAVGILVGAAVALMLAKPAMALAERLHVLAHIRHWPQYAYPALVFVAFQMSTMFESLRDLLSSISRAII